MEYYNFIVNPKSGRRVNIFGKLGKSILKKYLMNTNFFLMYGGAVKDVSQVQLSIPEIDANKDRIEPKNEIQIFEHRTIHYDNNKRLLQNLEICNCPIIATQNCTAKSTKILINEGSDSNSDEI